MAKNADDASDRLSWYNDGGEFEDYPGPTWDEPRYEPTPEAEIEHAGYTAGYALNWTAEPPGELASFHRMLWSLGKTRGVADRRKHDAEDDAFRREMQEWVAWRDSLHPDESIRAIGVLASRLEGGLG